MIGVEFFRPATANVNKQAQLSHRDRAMLHVIKYFAKALKVIENGTTRKLGYGFLFAFHSNYVYLVSHGASAHFYADDGQLHVNSLAADTDDAINCLQACVTAVEQWMKSNQLRLNPQKTQLIWLGSQQQLDKVTTTDIQLLKLKTRLFQQSYPDIIL